MAYSKTTWVNGVSPAVDATNLNKMETGIDEAHDAIENTSTGHDHDGTDSKKVDGSNIVNTPAGSIAATEVQAAIDELDTEKLAKASNLSDVADAATTFGNVKQAATETATGVIEKATTAECVTGTDTDRAVTPAGLTARMEAPGEIGGTTPAAATFTQTHWSKGADVASGSALSLGSDGNYFDVTGTTTITSIGTLGIGTMVILHFDGALTLTHNATDLVLPGAANITTSAGDEATFIEYATGDWRCINYSKADGTAVISGDTYGVSWDESADTYIRTGRIAGFATGQTLSDDLLPIQAAIRGCLLNDSGVVQYYTDPSDRTLKVGGGASVLTGADGQVMQQIPAFYYRYAYSGTTHTWEISQTPQSGFSLHPAFIKNNVFVPYRYIGAYEGTLYDASAARYTNGLQLTAGSTDFVNATKAITRTGESHPFSLLEVGDKIVVAGTTNNNGTFTVATAGDQTIIVSEAVVQELAVATATIETEKDFANDILCSVSGKALINDLTRANGRTIAAKRGTGWRQEDYDLASAIQLLYLVEYADFDSQSMIGNGLTDWSSGTWTGWNDLNPIETTGNSNSDGNATANASSGNGVAGSYMSYRGIENWYGHIWKWIDGININNNIPYVSNNDTQFADDTITNYTALGVTLHNANGWQNTLEQISRGFLPASVGASSGTKITDYYYQASGWCVVRMGSNSYDGVSAGAFYLDAHFASSLVSRFVGVRLTF